MISDRFCDYDGRWILIGDSAHFVDPLFSSGVAFALVYAATAALLIRATYDSGISEREKRDLWTDYDADWHGVARSFAVAIDQWYHAIAERHPSSVYWARRAESGFQDLRADTFHALVDTDISPDLFYVLTNGSGDPEDLGQAGAASKAIRRFAGEGLRGEVVPRLRDGVSVREGLTVEVVRVKASSEGGEDDQAAEGLARFWTGSGFGR